MRNLRKNIKIMMVNNSYAKKDSDIKVLLDDIQKRYNEYLKILTDKNKSSAEFKEAVIRIGQMEEIISLKKKLEFLNLKISEAKELSQNKEKDIGQLAREELESLVAEKKLVEEKIAFLLFPEDPTNLRNAVMEIRAGVGGEEAALFVRDLFRMYCRFCEKKGYITEVLSTHSSDTGGFKEIIFIVRGKGAYRDLKNEGGVHRVQRIPDTENYGRIHTSAATVAVFPDVEEQEIMIDQKDLKIDTFRSSGAGGQSVNKTSSAVRITHIPTGLVISCQDERSQIQNRAKALKILKVRLKSLYDSEKKGKIDSERKALIKTGQRSEKIRTYNFPQNRITDHRIELTLYNLDNIMEGNIEELIKNLRERFP